jgi:hypothetical protein
MNSIQDICKQYNIKNYTINPDGSIDVDGDVNLWNLGLTELPLIFNKVSGYFNCGVNELTTLKGSPRYVGDYFGCNKNQLTSLEFSPDYVGSYFSCELNNLTDNLCDTEIGSNFFTTLEQDGLIQGPLNSITNYQEWRKIIKRKLTLNELYTRHL